jgi:acetyltransferase-like isoleucine patch superfamily enzyme
VKPPRRKLGRIGQRFSADPFLWAGWLLLGRISTKLKSRYFGWLFHAPGLHLGPGCKVRGAKFIHFGSNVYVHGNLWLEAVTCNRDQRFAPRIEIADEVAFSEGVHISCIDRISIGRHVLIGSHAYISDHSHGQYNGSSQSHPDEPPAYRPLGGGGPVEIGENVWIGDNVVIVGPISIGRGSIIGANSVVRATVPDHTIVAGAPARVIKRFNAPAGRWEKP